MNVIFFHGFAGEAQEVEALLDFVPKKSLKFIPSLHNQERWNLELNALVSSICHEVLPLTAGPFLLGGYSMGGRIALLLAERLLLQHSRQPQRVILLSSGLGEDEQESRLQVDHNRALSLRNNPKIFWDEWYKQPLFSLSANSPEFFEWRKRREKLPALRLSQQLEAWSPARHKPLLPILKQLAAKGSSTLYIAGEQDKKYFGIGKKLKKQGITFKSIANCSHAIPLESPKACRLLLKEFLEK